VVLPHLNERQRRFVVGTSAEMCGPRTKTLVADAAGMSRNTVVKAAAEVYASIEPTDRVRAPGAGVKPITETQPISWPLWTSWSIPKPAGIQCR
jgi:hypothetical protein